MPWGDKTSLALMRRKSGETSLTSLLDLITGLEDWLAGLARRTGRKEPCRRKSGALAWCGRIFLPWRRSRVWSVILI